MAKCEFDPIETQRRRRGVAEWHRQEASHYSIWTAGWPNKARALIVYPVRVQSWNAAAEMINNHIRARRRTEEEGAQHKCIRQYGCHRRRAGHARLLARLCSQITFTDASRHACDARHPSKCHDDAASYVTTHRYHWPGNILSQKRLHANLPLVTCALSRDDAHVNHADGMAVCEEKQQGSQFFFVCVWSH